MAKPFCENRRGARCFAELFGTCISETIYDVVIFNVAIFGDLSIAITMSDALFAAVLTYYHAG
jgi:hypothetical protein